MDGIIVKGIDGFYYVASGGETYECRARGVFRKERTVPTVGDSVEISLNSGGGVITDIHPRRNYLVRPPVANVDNLIAVIAAKEPRPDLQLTDKMLINAEIHNIKPMLCINKTDLKNADEIGRIYREAGYRVYIVSAAENVGIDELRSDLCGKITAFAGQSGVGKSSILSIITGRGLETGNISEKISRGRHTTREVELFDIGKNTYVFDTPGFSSLEIEGIDKLGIQDYFPEISREKGNCRFRGCLHINEPDCAVKRGIANGKISESRYTSYKMFYEALSKINKWETGRLNK